MIGYYTAYSYRGSKNTGVRDFVSDEEYYDYLEDSYNDSSEKPEDKD